jgi:hypothetical protein
MAITTPRAVLMARGGSTGQRLLALNLNLQQKFQEGGSTAEPSGSTGRILVFSCMRGRW